MFIDFYSPEEPAANSSPNSPKVIHTLIAPPHMPNKHAPTIHILSATPSVSSNNLL